MTVYLVFPLVGLAAAGIFGLRPLTARLQRVLHPDPSVDFQIKFQSLQLMLAGVVLALTALLSPGNFVRFFRLGDVQAPIGKIAWLGISGSESWLEIAASLGLFVTLGTGVFMALQLKKAGVNARSLLFCLLWALPFSAANAFSEEAIFRIGIIAPLYGIWGVALIALVSGVIFGLPHYFGMPSGVAGVLMAGFLGWLLALSVMETHGLLIAWAIHFVQDVVIITSMLLMNSQRARKGTK
jgi:uncharacterized protein